MRPWPAPFVPRLPGRGSVLRLHDTEAGEVRPTEPGETARSYVCGITPYDATHMGHAATYIAFDLVQRVWLDAGHDVHYVQNVTDIDDPLLERARRDGVDWKALAEQEITRYSDDMTALAVLPPRELVGAVEAMDLIAEAVVALREKGVSYEVDGDVYFSVHADPAFGTIGHYDDATMLALAAERGGDPERPGKKHPLDCLLWQAERPGEPAWDSPLGRGRPGWHIECTAIALELLGDGFDVQGGGSDLVFPHHEMGASEGHLLTGRRPWARHHVHAGMVGLDGEKMSKSRGNLVFVSRLREQGVDPMAIRLAVISHHYRSDWEWSDASLAEATERLARWRAAVGAPTGRPGEEVVAGVRERMADDLDAPGAVAVVDAWVDAQLAEPGDDPSGPGLVGRALDALLGIRL